MYTQTQHNESIHMGPKDSKAYASYTKIYNGIKEKERQQWARANLKELSPQRNRKL